MPLADMQYAEGSTHAPPTGGVRIFPPGTVRLHFDSSIEPEFNYFLCKFRNPASRCTPK